MSEVMRLDRARVEEMGRRLGVREKMGDKLG